VRQSGQAHPTAAMRTLKIQNTWPNRNFLEKSIDYKYDRHNARWFGGGRYGKTQKKACQVILNQFLFGGAGVKPAPTSDINMLPDLFVSFQSETGIKP
jgi:hypothetical protein